MLSPNSPLVPPPGYTMTDLDTWSFACAAGHHDECKGTRTNPDPDCPAEEITLLCECGVCTHQAKKAGRPRKTAE
ncbi:hypothetical protein [Planomonospora sp. ID82291]|uniref:hypothetical protein n=1 Tax=Planomonospora sp. ID82291 TaxID=2738136 RepID=UPI0018C3D253|nr:hypothetical protein [Planomonospora sp. ID82291]MBG0818894.1 hypothetical protein [Planomonospora sp. ID82291]